VTLHLGFRGKLFLALAGLATVGVLLAATVVSVWLPRQTERRIQAALEADARLVAGALARFQAETPPGRLDQEADWFGRSLPARVTLIAGDGTVVGDSLVEASQVSRLDNHGGRPEVRAARATGRGVSKRHSATIGTDMLYVAVRTEHPLVSVVRLALPLHEVRDQVAAVRRATLAALGIALIAAAVLARMSSTFGRRLTALSAAARRYASGDLTEPVRDYGQDQLGLLARSLDDIVRNLAVRVGELARQRARTEAILASMVEGVLVVDANGQAQVVNDAARSMLGLDGDRAEGHYLELVRHPGVASLLTAALQGQTPPVLEMTPAKAPQRRLLARATAIRTNPGSGAVLVLHDITDLRRSDQVRRDFVANVSHELRTPLTAIKGYVEALADDPLSPDDRARFLDVIGRHAARMERLVRDLLRLASLDARQEAVERAPCALEVMLNGVVADLAPLVEARRQRVLIRVEPAVATIQTDAAKLQDAVRNLVENALNYSPEGRLVQIEATGRDGQVVLTVADEGPGIPEPDLERIFERFYRVDKARSRESGGTGLGLSIVKHLVEILGGHVWAANRPEGGAVFTITVPLVTLPLAAGTPHPS